MLVSSTVKDLVAGSGIEFDDRGVATLKGVPDQWRLYAVMDVPPLWEFPTLHHRGRQWTAP